MALVEQRYCVMFRPGSPGAEVFLCRRLRLDNRRDVGEIAKMVELGIGNKTERVNLGEIVTRSVKVVAGTGFEPVTFRL